METTVYNQAGKESGKISLPESVFGLPWNADLVHQVIAAFKSNARTPVAHTKTRGEVRGGGIKPWQQKGTGRARHGSIRSPLWRHGGVTHGPRNDRNFDRKINKKMNAKALYTILSRKYRDGEILFVDALSFERPKTKEAKGVLVSLSAVKGFKTLVSKKKNSAYIATDSKNIVVEKSFNNFPNLVVNEIRNLNALDVLNYKYLVIANPEASLKQISGKLEKTAK